MNNNEGCKYSIICSKDGKFFPTKAIIKNNIIIVWSDKVVAPVAARFALANNPGGVYLYNKERLPATPFRTDDFKWIN